MRGSDGLAPDAITFLGGATVAGSKRFTAAGVTPYACGAGPFSVLRVPVASLTDAAQYIAACPPNAFAIRGRAVGDAATIPYRRYRARPGEPPTIEAEAHRLLPIDVDADDRNGLDVEANARAYRDAILPEAFRGAACLAIATSSAGIKPGSRMRLWFWCNRAVSDAEAAAWLQEYDTAIYRPAQPIYCAAPTFDGVADPFEGRSRVVWLDGDEVEVPGENVFSREPTPRSSENRHTPIGGRNNRLTSLAGTLRRKGASESVLLATLLAANDEFPEPLDGEEVEQIAQSVANYAPESVQIAVAAKPATERTRQDAERVLKRVQERVKDDPENWRAHIETLGPHLATGAITPTIVATRVARTFGDASHVVSVAPGEIGAALDTLTQEGHTAIAVVQEGWLADKSPQLSKEGDALVPGAYNLGLVLRHAPDMQGIQWDPRFDFVRVWHSPWTRHGRKVGSVWDKADEHELRAWLCVQFGWVKPPGELFDAVVAASRSRERDWWRETLDICARGWDGVSRMRDTDLVSRMLGCEDAPAHREVFRKWLISSVARTYEPGAKVDDVLVLYSKQGRFKGRFLSALLGVGDGALSHGAAYYTSLTERTRDLSDKDVLAKLAGRVIVEIGENAALAARDQDAAKAFITERVDVYRAPYARSPEEHPRTCVFVITTNEPEFLTDSTGNRRYKVITCERGADVDLLRAELPQVWGEAVIAYQAGEPHHYAADAHAEETASYATTDPWVDGLRIAIGRSPQHLGIDLCEGGRVVGLRANDALALLEVPSVQRTQANSRRAGACLRALGWERGNRWVGGRQVKAFWRPVLDTPTHACERAKRVVV